MKKVLCFVLAAMMGVSLVLSGCSSKKEEAPVAKATAAPAETLPPDLGKMPVVKDKYTMKVFAGRDAGVSDLQNNEFTEELEKMTNVHIEWDQIEVAKVTERVNLMLASGDLPDVLLQSKVSLAQVMQYGSQGVFIPLNELIGKYTVNLKAAMIKSPYIKDQITSPDGKIYGLPRIDECYHCTVSDRMWINVPWLDKLGLKMPQTTEEFYNVLKAFKTRDPNGNGKADEIALSTYKGTSHMQQFLMNPFIYNDSNVWDGPYMEAVNGNIRFTANTPEFKQGLQYMKKLYDEKLLSPESFTQDVKQLMQLGEASEPVLGAVASFAYVDFTQNYGKSGRYLDYELVPALQGPSGTRWTVTRPYSATPNFFIITNKAKNPDVIMRWVDYFYGDEGTLAGSLGAKGKSWEFPEGKENPWRSLRGEPSSIISVSHPDPKAYDNLKNISWKAGAPAYKHNDLRESQPAYNTQAIDPATGAPRPVDYYKTYHEYRYMTYMKERREPYKKKETITNLMFNDAQAKRHAELRTAILPYVDESVLKFISGQMNLDSDWDNYVKELEKRGAAEFTKLVQEVYTSTKGKK